MKKKQHGIHNINRGTGWTCSACMLLNRSWVWGSVAGWGVSVGGCGYGCVGLWVGVDTGVGVSVPLCTCIFYLHSYSCLINNYYLVIWSSAVSCSLSPPPLLFSRFFVLLVFNSAHFASFPVLFTLSVIPSTP